MVRHHLLLAAVTDMRIGIVCPYSLTLPGGVQGQVLSLARALRARGHDVRVLGPCDGPPPDSGVTPLGDSLPTAANGSVAPIAPDPSAQLRDGLLKATGQRWSVELTTQEGAPSLREGADAARAAQAADPSLRLPPTPRRNCARFEHFATNASMS